MSSARTVYLAGKIAQNDWRHGIVAGLRDAMQGDECVLPRAWGILADSIAPTHHYSGPFFVSCDHGCMHGTDSHGVAANPVNDGACGAFQLDDPKTRGERVCKLCCAGIEACDLFFAWIDARDCYGSIAELGYAKALGKEIVIAWPRPDHDMWFCAEMADRVIVAPSPAWALAQVLFAE